MLTAEEGAADEAACREVEMLELYIAAQATKIHRSIDKLAGEALTAGRKRLREISHEVDGLYQDLYELVASATHETYTADDVRRWCQYSQERECGHPTFHAGVIRDLLHYRRVPNEQLRIAYLAKVEKIEQASRSERRSTRGRKPTSQTLAEQVVGILERMEQEDDEDYGSSAFRREPKPADKLARQLGIRRTSGGGKSTLAFLMPYELAVAVAIVLGMSPVEAGV